MVAWWRDWVCVLGSCIGVHIVTVIGLTIQVRMNMVAVVGGD